MLLAVLCALFGGFVVWVLDHLPNSALTKSDAWRKVTINYFQMLAREREEHKLPIKLMMATGQEVAGTLFSVTDSGLIELSTKEKLNSSFFTHISLIVGYTVL